MFIIFFLKYFKNILILINLERYFVLFIHFFLKNFLFKCSKFLIS